MAAWLGSVTYAHRGLHEEGVAENSTAAFAGAIARGLGIECDVRRSKDGQAIVFHDATLERLTNRQGRLDDLPVGEITQIALRDGGGTIPTLRDMLDQVVGQVPLLLEIKSDKGRDIEVLCRAVRRDLEGYHGPVAVMSFDPRVGRWFARKAPAIVRGLVVTEQDKRTWQAAVERHVSLWTSRAQFLAYDIRDLPGAFPARQRRRGLPLLTWTVKSPALRERAAAHADAPIAEGEGL
ncbi:glycerophosphodiester phosphodiesterase family protein [Alteraurantiacibacter aquimixticola]|uniref:glycerophosphodiester phosphodiesterase family protein n=1 Tax=Alteraurantiacibacter aquimixticola TaxID=2489173 RepID=UPI001FE7458C|nr:glycerophosphodiester phosphodiesterase family protein [Alteraurantiacibacter aquimixticola]